jgi:type II secretory pathway pseudopilin PulG
MALGPIEQQRADPGLHSTWAAAAHHSVLAGGTARGFTLVETAVMVVIVGLLLQIVITGQQLIHNARVRDIISQQTAVETAVMAFQDRYHALPGDYALASSNIACDPSPCLNGNGNGHVEAGTGGAIHEEILAWQHLYAGGYLSVGFRMSVGETAATPQNTPRNIFGGYLELAYDANWGYSGNGASRHNIKTGNYVSAAVLGEVDRKVDDGRPGSGRFQFSRYAGFGPPPPVGGTAGACTDADTPTAAWAVKVDNDNCGGATLLY